ENATENHFTIKYDGGAAQPGHGALTFNGQGAGDIMTLTRAGRVGIGTKLASEKLEVVGNIKAQAYLYTSDARLKENVKTYDNALLKILALRGVNFNWI